MSRAAAAVAARAFAVRPPRATRDDPAGAPARSRALPARRAESARFAMFHLPPTAAVLLASPPAHALLEVRDGVFATDADVAKTTVATLAALALATLAASESPPLDELAARLDAVEPLEVRLDITTLWCFVLARELFHVPPGGRVVDLGFSLDDILRLGCVLASGSALCVAWLLVGILAGQFRRGNLGPEPAVTLERYLAPGWTTGVVAGVAWQLAEAYLCRDMDATATMATTMTFGGDAEAVTAAARIDPAAAASSVSALVASMQCYRVFSYFVP
jgi:hypothetical protein